MLKMTAQFVQVKRWVLLKMEVQPLRGLGLPMDQQFSLIQLLKTLLQRMFQMVKSLQLQSRRVEDVQVQLRQLQL